MMTFLLYVMSFGWVLALFVSFVALVCFVSVRVYRSLTAPLPDPEVEARKKRENWNPNEWKRAGQ
jgi:hypothetical protein